MRTKVCKSAKPRNKKRGLIGFSNEKFLELVANLAGITPVGELGRETPLDLTTPERARGSLLMKEIFSKYDDGKPSEEKEKKTWERFHDAERFCSNANQQMKYWRLDSHLFWRMVAARIHLMLGRFDWTECSQYFGHGPGGTTRLTRARSAAAYKYSGIPESTSGNAIVARAAVAAVPLWKHNALNTRGNESGELVKLVSGNSIIAVPKNYKTDRTIAKEPCMNVYVQKGIGGVLRRRLRSVGVDLDDQTRNQRGALEGSLTGGLATIDLSMASDTLAYELVHFLLPPEWVWGLEQARSPRGVLPSGEVIQYQKYSSMGNGYTFELESLIFWAIVQTCIHPFNIYEREKSVCVYGDDLVVPASHYALICVRLREAGFTPNPNKSYGEGPYRESCGKHYFCGADITPFYVRKPVQSLDRLFLVHNNLYRWCMRTGVDGSEVLTKLRELAPAKWRRPRLPDGFGDGAFIGPVDELQLDSHPFGWECWQVKALSRMSEELADDLPEGQLLASLIAGSTGRSDDDNLYQVVGRNRFGEEPSVLAEHSSGLPAREGQFREINLNIPRQLHSPLA